MEADGIRTRAGALLGHTLSLLATRARTLSRSLSIRSTIAQITTEYLGEFSRGKNISSSCLSFPKFLTLCLFSLSLNKRFSLSLPLCQSVFFFLPFENELASVSRSSSKEGKTRRDHSYVSRAARTKRGRVINSIVRRNILFSDRLRGDERIHAM